MHRQARKVVSTLGLHIAVHLPSAFTCFRGLVWLVCAGSCVGGFQRSAGDLVVAIALALGRVLWEALQLIVQVLQSTPLFPHHCSCNRDAPLSGLSGSNSLAHGGISLQHLICLPAWMRLTVSCKHQHEPQLR